MWLLSGIGAGFEGSEGFEPPTPPLHYFGPKFACKTICFVHFCVLECVLSHRRKKNRDWLWGLRPKLCWGSF